MFNSTEDQENYIRETYPEITDSRIDDSHWDLNCSKCNQTRGFQVVERSEGRIHNPVYSSYNVDNEAPMGIYFRCPVCKNYKQWVVYKIYDVEKSGYRYYRVASLPSEGIEDIKEIPENPVELRIAYKQAIRSMDANAHIAAAAMFRRALQVITRKIIGVNPGNLANELKESVGKKVGTVTITNDFADVGYIVKEAGNQGAHPDADPDLLDFTAQDAEDLQKIFMEMITDLFVVPVAIQKSKDEFLKRRKI